MSKNIREILVYLIIILAIILIRIFVITPIRVVGNSMNNTLKNGDILILNKLDKSYKRFDIVVIKYTNEANETERIIKRIIGLPGEYINYKDNNLYVNNEIISENFDHAETNDFKLEDIISSKKIPNNYFLVLGDNRTQSLDSRIIGLIKKDDIEGVVNFRFLPMNKFGKIS